MSFLDDISRSIADAGQSTFQKGKEIADVAKLNGMIGEEERKITNVKLEIGKLYVEKFGDNPDPVFNELFACIKESNDKIESYKQQLQVVKGIKTCVSCGAEIAIDSVFCATCGTKQPEIENTVDPVNVDTIKCPTCGAILPAGSKFCSVCGKSIEG